MIRPEALSSPQPHGPWSCRGSDIWDVLCAAEAGDLAKLRDLLDRDPNLSRAEYWYTQPIHLAVREGRLEATRHLLAAGADPDALGLGDNLLTTALDRDHEAVGSLIEAARLQTGRVRPAAADHPIHGAAATNDTEQIRTLLDTEPGLVDRGDRLGGSPLHRAVAASASEALSLLFDRGADVHARHGCGQGPGAAYAPRDFQPIDLALWNGPFWGLRGDLDTVQRLVEHGAERDVAVATALGDLDGVRRMLDADPKRRGEARPCGKGALSTAVELGHGTIARLLLERGADPNAPRAAPTA